MPGNIDQVLRHSATLLAGSSSSPRLDAEVLLMHVTGLGRTELITHAQRPLSESQESELGALVARRARGEPVAYLTGQREFWSLMLHITPDVLIPRPETELLVELALERLPESLTARIADLGTGSGAIALALASERPRCELLATDISTRALDVARHNAECLGLTNIDFRPGRWLEAAAGEKFDLIVSNPPYVRRDDPHLRQGDVRFEPETALVAGTDGLEALRAIVTQARSRLGTQGWLLLEHGFDQASTVRALLQENGFDRVATHQDLSGQDRVSLGHRTY